MGLDMYLLAKKKGSNETLKEIGYWRKHPDLHSYIAKLYYESGGTAEVFNGIKYELSKEIIEKIILLSKEKKLPKSEGGFFFGETQESDHETTVDILEKALGYVKKDYEIIYDSWW